MGKKINSIKNPNVLEKIRIAREMAEMLKNKNLHEGIAGLRKQLREICDRAELMYNDVLIKQYKSVSAEKELEKLEAKLDDLTIKMSKIINEKAQSCK